MYLEEKVDLLIKQNEQLIEYINLFLPDLTTKKGVVHFLEISTNTFNKYIDENIFEEGIHYYKSNDKLIFDKDEIIKFKTSGQVGRKRKDNKKDALDTINKKFNIIDTSKSADKGIL